MQHVLSCIYRAVQLTEELGGQLQSVTEVAALYDMDTGRFSPIRIREAPFCAGHIYGPTVSTAA